MMTQTIVSCVTVAGTDRLVAVAGEAGGRPGESLPRLGGEASGPPCPTLRLGLAGTADRCTVVHHPPGLGTCLLHPTLHLPPSTSQCCRH